MNETIRLYNEWYAAQENWEKITKDFPSKSDKEISEHGVSFEKENRV